MTTPKKPGSLSDPRHGAGHTRRKPCQRRRWWCGALLLGCCAALPGTPAVAHLLAPSLLEVRATASPGILDVLWRTPRLAASPPQPQLPCTVLRHSLASPDAQALQHSWRLDCGHDGIDGRVFGVSGLTTGGSPTLLRVLLPGETPVEVLLSAAQPSFRIAQGGRQNGGQTARQETSLLRQHFLLGIAHLWGGWDHLAFLGGLVLLFSAAPGLILACSAFTLGHLVPLSLATLGLLRYPVLWVELGIALSILLLAWELVQLRQSAPATQKSSGSLLRRHPLLLPGAFGLLHGMGFAQGLSQLGLHEYSVPLALLGLNLGIESGQLLIIAVLVALLWVLRRAWPTAAVQPRIPGYILGGLAVCWCLIALENLLR